ncbi:hypothetical protein EMPS_01781 [Entomortierella parvispora]|uniref:PHD-type domain-containing protein n=1 Tax=Entomortierella parvispora TaxID=205924 RepID=A0A9P3H3H1_9FUNG|nr:hypothetical protein EMPS_01781 [Entomortierella parvispora]
MFSQVPARAIVLSESPSSSEIKAPRKSVARKSKVLKENVEISQGSLSPTVSLAHLPIQKQSTKIRKRLLVDNEVSPGDQSTTKKHKIRIDETQSSPPTLSVVSALRIPPLHRTLSDKSSYLNLSTTQEPSSVLPKAQSTLSSWRRVSQSPKASSDGEDADDEDEDSPDQVPSSQESIAHKQGQPLSPTIPVATSRPEVVVKKLSSIEGEIFGSDTTLTSPEDDSDEEPQNSIATSSAGVLVPPPPLRLSSAPRRGPGRPRKTPLTHQNVDKKADTATQVSSSVSNTQSSTSKEDDGGSLNATVLTAEVALGIGLQLPQPPRSLMDRILNQDKAEQDERCFSSDDDAGQIEQASSVNPLLAKGVPDSTSNTEPPLDVVISAVLSGLAKDVAAPNNPELSTDFNRVSTVVIEPFAVAESLQNNDDSLFLKPIFPITRGFVANRSHRARRDSRASRTKPLRRASPSAPSIAKAVESQPFFRRTFSPRLFQTCRDIMTPAGSANSIANIPQLKAMLRQNLKQGLMTVRGASAMDSNRLQRETLPSTDDSLLLGWGSVIGNGKGLFSRPSRKEAEELRIEQRRTMVSEAYARLNLPPPRENWDVSSQVILGGLSFKSFPAMAAERNSGRWTTAMEEAMDRISSHVGCNFCRKTFKNRSGLANHLSQCSMARRQTSISNDSDGDSTASETEDQREARSPDSTKTAKAPLVPNAVSESENSEDAEDDVEDEEGVIMCVCGTKDDEGAMVQCDKCEVWLHLECLDLTEDEVPEEYFCPTCLGLPTPSTGGKSFRHIPSKISRRKSRQRKDSREFRSLSLSATSDSECGIEKRDDRLQSPQQSPLLESEQEFRREDSLITEEENEEHDESRYESAVSPQVVLNHDWDQEALDPSSELGFDVEYMHSLYGGTSARAIFKKPRAPALMLDGSSSQTDQMDMMAPLLSSDLGIEDFESLLSEGGHPPSMGLELCSDGDLTFSDSQSSQYASQSLFEQGYSTGLDTSPDLTLTSEDTLDSEGYRTPIDLRHDVDHVEHWAMDPFGNDYGPDACMSKHSKRATTTDVEDWYQTAPGDEFDLDGLIDLGAVST